MKISRFILPCLALMAFAILATIADTASAHQLLDTDWMSGLAMAGTAVAVVPDEIKAQLSRISDEIKSFADKSDKEIKAQGKLTEETRASVDKLLTTQGELQARLQSAEQMMAKLEAGGGQPAKPKSLGEVVANNEEFQSFATRAVKGQTFSMSVKAAITSDSASAGSLVVPQRVPGIVTPGQQRLFVRDLLPWGRTDSSAIEYVRETGFTNNAAPVSELPTSGKPESNLQFEMLSAPVVTIAHHVRASKQILADAAQLQSYINGRLQYGLKLKEELQLLKGSGTGLNINGLITQASPYVNPGVAAQAETRIDRLRLAMLQVALTEFYADGIVLNPIDWAAIELTKTKENAYLFANPHGQQAPSLWGLPVVPTQSVDPSEFLVGSFQQGAQGWDREDLTVIISLEDRDNIIKNAVTILVEERVALTDFRPDSFVTGDFDDLVPVSGE